MKSNRVFELLTDTIFTIKKTGDECQTFKIKQIIYICVYLNQGEGNLIDFSLWILVIIFGDFRKKVVKCVLEKNRLGD